MNFFRFVSFVTISHSDLIFKSEINRFKKPLSYVSIEVENKIESQTLINCKCPELFGLPGCSGPQGPPGRSKSEYECRSQNGGPGFPGAKGEKGSKGFNGGCGPQGSKGETGFPGAPGPPGPSGSPGLTGEDGRGGLTGDPGTAGFPGPKGDTGPDGSPGTPNLDRGQPGAPGPKGFPGMTGQNGKQGGPGENGCDCKSSIDLNQCQEGKPGRRGYAGQRGLPGPDGRCIDCKEEDFISFECVPSVFSTCFFVTKTETDDSKVQIITDLGSQKPEYPDLSRHNPNGNTEQDDNMRNLNPFNPKGGSGNDNREEVYVTRGDDHRVDDREVIRGHDELGGPITLGPISDDFFPGKSLNGGNRNGQGVVQPTVPAYDDYQREEVDYAEGNIDTNQLNHLKTESERNSTSKGNENIFEKHEEELDYKLVAISLLGDMIVFCYTAFIVFYVMRNEKRKALRK